MTRVFYNEWDPFCAQWLRNLIAAGELPEGDVDERDIRDVRPSDLDDYTQCHFFAGIGGWPLALKLAGWGDAPVWTGSCPCQPFSSAGRNLGFADDRHLWPAWHWLISQCCPRVIFGEQVSAAVARDWFDLVSLQLEMAGYAVGAAVLPACSVGAPHIRQRLWFAAHAISGELRNESRWRSGTDGTRSSIARDHGEACLVADTGLYQKGSSSISGCDGSSVRSQKTTHAPGCSEGFNVAHSDSGRCVARRFEESSGLNGTHGRKPDGRGAIRQQLDAAQAIGANSDGSSAQQRFSITAEQEHSAVEFGDWWRVEPEVARVAHGVSARVGKLRAFGNAIVPQVAAEFIKAYREALSSGAGVIP